MVLANALHAFKRWFDPSRGHQFHAPVLQPGNETAGTKICPIDLVVNDDRMTCDSRVCKSLIGHYLSILQKFHGLDLFIKSIFVYILMNETKRVYVEKEDLKAVINTLRARGISARQASRRIKYDLRHALYYGYGIDQESFDKLEDLYGSSINNITKNAVSIKPIKSVVIDEKLAECVGILLGDGCIEQRGIVSVALNGVDEKEYVEYVISLLYDVFGFTTKIYNKKGKGVNLVINSRNLVSFLLSIGMKSGNKVVNQVGVPSWVKENLDFCIACLRGLIDTDGCLSYRERNDAIQISFNNRSFNLLKDFAQMCDVLGIKTRSRYHPRTSGCCTSSSAILDCTTK